MRRTRARRRSARTPRPGARPAPGAGRGAGARAPRRRGPARRERRGPRPRPARSTARRAGGRAGACSGVIRFSAYSWRCSMTPADRRTASRPWPAPPSVTGRFPPREPRWGVLRLRSIRPYRPRRASYSAGMAVDEPGPGVTDLEANACWALLRSHEVGRLAVSIADRPEIFPVNYVVDHGTVVFRTAEGTKLAGAVQRDVAFEADGYEPETGEAWSVVVKGRAEEICAGTNCLTPPTCRCSRGTRRRSSGSCGSCPTRSPAAGFTLSAARPGGRRGRERPGRHPNDSRDTRRRSPRPRSKQR